MDCVDGQRCEQCQEMPTHHRPLLHRSSVGHDQRSTSFTNGPATTTAPRRHQVSMPRRNARPALGSPRHAGCQRGAHRPGHHVIYPRRVRPPGSERTVWRPHRGYGAVLRLLRCRAVHDDRRRAPSRHAPLSNGNASLHTRARPVSVPRRHQSIRDLAAWRECRHSR